MTRDFPTRSALFLAVLLSATAISAPALAQDTPYEVRLTGEAGGDLRETLRQVSRLFTLRDDPPPSPIGLRRRADADQERLTAALRSAGYFDSTLNIQVDTQANPAQVTVEVIPGPRYRIKSVTVEPVGDLPLPGAPITGRDLGLNPDDVATGPAVVAAQDAIGPMLAQRGHAYNRVIDRRLVIDHSDRSMTVTYYVAPGPLVTIGEIAVQGLDRVEERTVRRRLALETGQIFDPEDIAQAREDLSDLGVFSGIRVRVADQPTPDGTAPVTVDLTERELRFIGFGVNFATEEGFGGNAYWGHRNLFGGAERLRVSAEIAGVGRDSFGDVGEFDYRVGATYEEPDFYIRGQTLTLSAQALSEQPDAFRRDAIVLSGAIERLLWEDVTGSLGVFFEQSRVEEGEQTTTNTLVGIPATLTVDRSNDVLNPTTGWRANAAVTPFLAAFGDSESFTISRIGGSAYWDFSGDGSMVAAGRAVLGSIVGVGGLLDIPADKRFYAGGGGSVRGYGYQEVGPIGIDGEPLGGRSLIEVGAEVRFKVTESIGLVPFIDGGNVFISEYPDFDEELRWGAGLGVRYYTGIGPLRLDVAFPLNKRQRDSDWQLYISLGQAF
ncbi:autotransporter assembly complex protein TamA [Indioceanicola profundi]|uniref:autotransporter assembly complex protein TamA n=1 Tax=Indioceanicola profundi TaxID=2220096 RepID=UPI000E6AB93C|nr:autotransporter assembly complex family protein [Indioceanicola profundi]